MRVLERGSVVFVFRDNRDFLSRFAVGSSENNTHRYL